MNAFELLKADHKKVAELFDRLEAAKGKAKLNLFQQIKSELELHTHIEEKIFYPALEKPEETHDLTLEAYEEHKVVKTLLAELAAARTANDEWQAKAKVLRENVEHHVKEEEDELFDKADDALSDEEIEALGNQMEAEKARKRGSAIPKQPGAKGAEETKVTDDKPGLLSRIATFIGLGADPANETIAKKSPTKKTPAKKSAAKKVAARKVSPAGARTAGKKKARVTATATAVKRSSAAQGAKRAPSRVTSSKKAGAAKKAAKKRAGGK